MKKIAIVMASLMVTIAAQAALPIGTVLHNETGPADRVTLQNGVVTVVVPLHGLDTGTWLVWGACTVQDSVIQGVPGWYLYTYTAISQSPYRMPGGGLQSLDARPYDTYWFAANPPPRVFHFTGDPALYLIAESYGQAAPLLSQAFGSIIAQKTGN